MMRLGARRGIATIHLDDMKRSVICPVARGQVRYEVGSFHCHRFTYTGVILHPVTHICKLALNGHRKE